MAEIIELYFEMVYRLVGFLIYGRKFRQHESVPLYIKTIAVILTVVIAGFLIWLLMELIS